MKIEKESFYVCFCHDTYYGGNHGYYFEPITDEFVN